MASNPSDLLKFEKQTTGENDSTWGTKANTAMSRIEEGIADVTNISLNALGGANYTLDDTQYAEHVDGSNTSESHCATIKATGTLDTAEQIIVPLRNKQYLIWNATSGSFAVTIGGATGGTVTVPQGYLMSVVCDGTNVEAASTPIDVTGYIQRVDSIELGHDTDTTLSRSAAGVLAVEGVVIGLTGKQAIPIPAIGMYAPTTSGAAAGNTETSTNKVQIKTWDFDKDADEYVQFQFSAPKSWNESTVTFKVHWSHAATATNFGVTFALQGLALGNSDALDAAWGTAVTVDDTGGTTDDIFSTPESSAITLSGTPAENDLLIFRLLRDISDANDDMAIDARAHGITLYLTTNVGNDA